MIQFHPDCPSSSHDIIGILIRQALCAFIKLYYLWWSSESFLILCSSFHHDKNVSLNLSGSEMSKGRQKSPELRRYKIQVEAQRTSWKNRKKSWNQVRLRPRTIIFWFIFLLLLVHHLITWKAFLFISWFEFKSISFFLMAFSLPLMDTIVIV